MRYLLHLVCLANWAPHGGIVVWLRCRQIASYQREVDALAASDATHVGKRVRHLIPVLVRIAVVLWLMGKKAEGLQALQQARRRNRQVANGKRICSTTISGGHGR